MTPAETQAAFSEVREALESGRAKAALLEGRDYDRIEWESHFAALARIESEVARLTEERDEFMRWHVAELERRETAEAKIARLERIEEAAWRLANSPAGGRYGFLPLLNTLEGEGDDQQPV